MNQGPTRRRWWLAAIGTALVLASVPVAMATYFAWGLLGLSVKTYEEAGGANFVRYQKNAERIRAGLPPLPVQPEDRYDPDAGAREVGLMALAALAMFAGGIELGRRGLKARPLPSPSPQRGS